MKYGGNKRKWLLHFTKDGLLFEPEPFTAFFLGDETQMTKKNVLSLLFWIFSLL
jgi:hypothetical protein